MGAPLATERQITAAITPWETMVAAALPALELEGLAAANLRNDRTETRRGFCFAAF
ncbi:hypothetical protein SM0020_23237 [Sinorhizobium meliloti CCNWSX0020]|uniref:Uncharacterized protein n=1 Tax=Sinorhizobium meliloti CCNWSX0020 TaxID=1107881 RepID=H0G5A7_RHIML|nr:hypothetical protein SM0020_23237 [Sinorhizobium meliloti CCNWSX0020]PII38885.1 hypothetical protein T190_13495 [Sinorhizobium meliloti CCBAU 01290]